MKKVIGVVIALLAAAALALLVIPTTRDEIHWQWASHKDKMAGYESYLQTWPAGRHTTEAKARYDEHAWAEAQAANTVQGFEQYVQLHESGRHLAEAEENIDTLHWQEALAADTVQGFERYVQLHESGRHLAEVEENIDTLDWKNVKYIDTLWAFEEYLRRHADGKYAAEAQEAAAWKRALAGNTIHAYEEYISVCPKGVHHKDAQTQIDALIAAYDAFMDEHLGVKLSPSVKIIMDYPATVTATRSPYWDTADFIYQWDTDFREIGGIAGCKLEAQDFYIAAPNGEHYSNGWSEDVTVPAGGSAKSDYWCDTSSKWDNGYFHAVWVGQDDQGNRIRIVQIVHFKR